VNKLLLSGLVLTQCLTLVAAGFLYSETKTLRQSHKQLHNQISELQQAKSQQEHTAKSHQDNVTTPAILAAIQEDLTHLRGENQYLKNETQSLKHSLLAIEASEMNSSDSDYTEVETQSIQTVENVFLNDDQNTDNPMITAIANNISATFDNEEITGAQLIDMDCRANSCRLQVNISDLRQTDTAPFTISEQIDSEHVFETEFHDDGSFTMYFSLVPDSLAP